MTSTTCAAPRKDMKVEYPIAIDNDYAIWDAFRNHYWPALYFVDAQGTSATITSARALRTVGAGHPTLAGRGRRGDIGHDLVSVDARGAEAAADWDSLQSPETYVGYARTEHFRLSRWCGAERGARYARPRAAAG